MKRPSEVEDLADKLVQDYVLAAEAGTFPEITNALMMLLTVAGVGLVASIGHTEAVGLLRALAEHIDTEHAGFEPHQRPTLQ